MHLAFYRKYRPKEFDQLEGQNVIKETLIKALKNSSLSHAYLFSGPRGTGKTSTARLIAQAIQCESRQESGQACGQCFVCEKNRKNELIDLVEIDAASNRGIDEIRELREKMRFAPSYAKTKVYIIDEVHMLTKEAFNALLKSLEEPPEHVVFILATTEIHKIPETIISRCQRYDFKRISSEYIVKKLKEICLAENIKASDEALKLIAENSNGGMRDAISSLEQFSHEEISEDLIRERLGLADFQICEDLYTAICSGEIIKSLSLIKELHESGKDLNQFTISFLGFLRKKLHLHLEKDEKNKAFEVLEIIDFFDKAWLNLKKTSISQLPLEIAVIKSSSKYVNDSKIAETMEDVASDEISILEAKLDQALNSINNPAVRNSFQTGKIIDFKDDVLNVSFLSQFHYEKVHSADSIVLVEDALKLILKKDIKLICKFGE